MIDVLIFGLAVATGLLSMFALTLRKRDRLASAMPKRSSKEASPDDPNVAAKALVDRVIDETADDPEDHTDTRNPPLPEPTK